MQEEPGFKKYFPSPIREARSALNLRLLLASTGLAGSVVFAAFFLAKGVAPLVAVGIVVALISAVDIVIIQLRRRARHRTHPHAKYTLFE